MNKCVKATYMTLMTKHDVFLLRDFGISKREWLEFQRHIKWCGQKVDKVYSKDGELYHVK